MVFLSLTVLKKLKFPIRISSYNPLIHTSILLVPCSGFPSIETDVSILCLNPPSLISFEPLALLPLLVEKTHFFCTKRSDLVCLKLMSGMPVTVTKELLNIPKMVN